MVKCVSWKPEGGFVKAAIVVEKPAEDVKDEMLDVLEVEVHKEVSAPGV